MAQEHGEARVTHYLDPQQRKIICGLEDRAAHWTTRGGVNCPDCSGILRSRERPYEPKPRGTTH